MLRLAPSVHTPPNASRRQGRVITAGALALVVVVALALFLDLGRPAFWDPGESRYAEAVREMLLTGNWIGPTLNFARYYDKPPGYFWLLAGAFTAFGPDEWAARLPSAVAGALTIALVVGFAWRRVGARAALGAGLILATAVAVRGTRPLGQDGHAADPARDRDVASGVHDLRSERDAGVHGVASDVAALRPSRRWASW